MWASLRMIAVISIGAVRVAREAVIRKGRSKLLAVSSSGCAKRFGQ
jgi:hypothetical protein